MWDREQQISDMQQFAGSQPDGNIGIHSPPMQDIDLKKIFIDKIARLMVDHTVCKWLMDYNL